MADSRTSYSRMRVLVAALLIFVAVAWVVYRFAGGPPAPSPSPPPPPQFVPPDNEILVASLGANAIVGFSVSATDRADEAAVRVIGGGLSPTEQSGLQNPFWLTVDRGGRIFTSNLGDGAQPSATSAVPPRIIVHEADANGGAAPFAQFDRNTVGYANPRGLVVRRNPAALFIVNRTDAGQSGVLETELPNGGPGTGALRGAGLTLVDPAGIALDRVFNVYVADAATNSVNVYGAWQAFTACDCAPIRTLAGRNTALDRPIGLAFDSRGNLYVTNFRQDTSNYGFVSVFAPDVGGDVAPIRILGVPYGAGNTPPNLRRPIGIALGRLDRMFVSQENEVLVFERDASGNDAPLQHLQHEKLNQTAGIAFRHN